MERLEPLFLMATAAQACNNYASLSYTYNYYYKSYSSYLTYSSYNLCNGQYCSYGSSCQASSCINSKCGFSSAGTPGAVAEVIIGWVFIAFLIIFCCVRCNRKRRHHHLQHNLLMINQQHTLTQHM